MNKCLKLLMVAIFASMTFTFVACGDDDDDEPNNGSNSGSGAITLTLDGTNYSFDSGACVYNLNEDNIVTEFMDSKSSKWIYFIFNEAEELSNGMVLTADMDINSRTPVELAVINFDGHSAGNYVLESGSIKINKLNRNTDEFEVTFNNAVFEEYSGLWDTPSIMVKGSFSVSFGTRWGPVFSSPGN